MMTDVYVPARKSFGFLRFDRLSDAHLALQRSVGLRVNGAEITCELAEGDKRSSQDMAFGVGEAVNFDHSDAQMFGNEVSIKVNNLPPDTSPTELCEAFAHAGIDSMTDCYIPQGRKFGFLRFQTIAEGKFAIQRSVSLRGHLLELEPAMGGKRSSAEMKAVWSGVDAIGRPPKSARHW